MHLLMSRIIRHYVAYNPPQYMTQYRVFNPRTCTGAELFQLSIHPRDVMCRFISNGLTIPKRSPVWPTQGLKLSRVQFHRVTIFPIWFKMGLCAYTWYVQGALFLIILLISHLLWSCAIFFFITLISDGFLSPPSRGSPGYICSWQNSTWLFVQGFHEVWRHGENL